MITKYEDFTNEEYKHLRKINFQYQNQFLYIPS